MSDRYLAVDIGASSGRHILGTVENGRIKIEEVWRFENKLVKKNGHLCWDTDHLFAEIVAGMKQCATLGKIPTTMGIDTWGVDYVLLDKDGAVLGDTVAYRDSRTDDMDKAVNAVISEEELYARTGIQKQLYNTIYQLMSVKQTQPELLDKADRLLMIPEYFNYRLTGVKMNEYTNASTTNLLDAAAKDWDTMLLKKLGFPRAMFGELKLPGTEVGHLSEAIRAEVGYDCRVVLPATHDTGSAVAAVPANGENHLYLSSGTWSLMGIESLTANCTEASRRLNVTNEGGVQYRYRYLKNIMGLWMLQSVKRELENRYSFDELLHMTEDAKINTIIDINDHRFLAPNSMMEAVKSLCAETHQQVPETVGEITRVIYYSLAKSYGDTVRELETITGRTFDNLHIVGGGSKDDLLNRLTAQATGKNVYAGPTEATALGNLLVQMLADGKFATLAEARQAVAVSFAVKKVEI